MSETRGLNPATDAVLAADDRRLAACVAGDATTLAELLTDDFTYTHSNGFREGREPFLARLREARVRYLRMTRQQADVRLHGDIALIHGLASMTYQLAARNVPDTLETLYLAAWTRSSGHWRIVAYASTQLAST